MNAATRRMLQALGALTPPPKPAEIRAFLAQLRALDKAGELDSVLAKVGIVASAAARTEPKVEDQIKTRLRQFGGKGADFLPFLETEANAWLAKAAPEAKLRFTSKTSLSAAIAKTETILGPAAGGVIQAALAAYIEVYDTSYRLKSG